jgi:hypothetical protein
VQALKERIAELQKEPEAAKVKYMFRRPGWTVNADDELVKIKKKKKKVVEE